MTLADFLRDKNTRVAPSPDFARLYLGGTGAPTAATPPWFLFYCDESTNTLHVNTDGTLAGWLTLPPGVALTAGGQVLTVTP